MEKRNPIEMFGNAKPAKVVKEKKRNHDEINLQEKFCLWLKKHYPCVKFIRHEKEKARSSFLSRQMLNLNSLDGIPDFEGLLIIGAYFGFYIEFKKPGESWLMADGITVKKEYQHQYLCHRYLWNIKRCVYFCNDFEDAVKLFTHYFSGCPIAQQMYHVKELVIDDSFLVSRGL